VIAPRYSTATNCDEAAVAVGQTMANRQHRLSEFDQGAPPSNQPLEILCEDDCGTYLLPYRCQFVDGEWRTLERNTAITAKVLGWRAVRQRSWP
jgi:hypothetical protein